MEQRMFHWEIGGHNLRFIRPPRSYCIWKSQKRMHTMIMLRPMASFCQREKWLRRDFLSSVCAYLKFKPGYFTNWCRETVKMAMQPGNRRELDPRRT